MAYRALSRRVQVLSKDCNVDSKRDSSIRCGEHLIYSACRVRANAYGLVSKRYGLVSMRYGLVSMRYQLNSKRDEVDVFGCDLISKAGGVRSKGCEVGSKRVGIDSTRGGHDAMVRRGDLDPRLPQQEGASK